MRRRLKGREITLGILACFLLLLVLRPDPAPRRIAQRIAGQIPEIAREPALGFGQPDAEAAEARETRGEIAHPPAVVVGAPLIERVRIYPERICAGRPFLVRIDAHDPDGHDDELISGVDGETGSPVVLTRDEPGRTWLLASAFTLRGNRDQRPIAVDVEDCSEGTELLSVRLFSAGPAGVAGFSALLPAGASRERAWTYHWDFGDGARATTERPYVEHDYRERPQTSILSTFLVRVIARSGQEMIEGMVAVPMMNLHALNRSYKGLIVPEVIPRGAGVEGGKAYIEATVRHWESEPLRLEEIRSAKLTPCDGRQEIALRLDWSMFSARELVPGATDLRVEIPADLLGAHCAVTIELGGPGANGRPMHLYLAASFRFPPRPAGLQISRAQAERLDKVAELLGKDLSAPEVWISDAELELLQREGLLDPSPP